MAVRVVDTNVISYVLRGRPIGRKYKPHLAGHSLVASFMTVAELFLWGVGHRWDQTQWRRLTTMLAGYDIPPVDDDLCWHWASVCHERRRRPISTADAWIAAEARRFGAELVTHNPADFQGITGLTVITEAP
jgi:predicted nucleic acid-binding protein